MREAHTKVDDCVGKEGHREGDDGINAVDLLTGGFSSAGHAARKEAMGYTQQPALGLKSDVEVEAGDEGPCH
jgi:hypothetical protein